MNVLAGQPDCLALLKLALPLTLVELTNLPDSLIVAEPAGVPLAMCLALPLYEKEPLACTFVGLASRIAPRLFLLTKHWIVKLES